MTATGGRLRSRGRRRAARDAGMVSAEFAAALPVVVLMLLLALGAIRAGIDQVQVSDAARVAARAAARGDSATQIQALVHSDGPPGATAEVTVEGDTVTVTVRAPGRFITGWGTGWAPSARVVAPREAEQP